MFEPVRNAVGFKSFRCEGRSVAQNDFGKHRTDWLKLERRLRESLGHWKEFEAACYTSEEQHDMAVTVLHAISIAIGDETGRGYPLGE